MSGFRLHEQLEKDTHAVADIGLCLLRLMDDRRYPWLIMVPKRAGITEIHDLSPLDQTMLAFETAQIAQMLKTMTGCHKINTAALGNMVPQLHVHVIARNIDDAAWPGPVWGVGKAVPYGRDEAEQFIANLASGL